MNRVIFAPDYFPDPAIGRPVANGNIYVGIVDLDPTIEANRKEVSVQEEDGTIVPISVASQPIRTSSGGEPIYNGSIVTILTDGNYSLAITDQNDVQKYYMASEPGFDNSTLSVDDMLGLIELEGQSNGDTADISGYFISSPQSEFHGGGVFVWQSGLDKATANGGTIIDPDNIGGFNGTVSTRDAFLTVQGGGVGTGCWVRDKDVITVLDFGAVVGGVVDNSGAAQANLDTILGGGKLSFTEDTYKLDTLVSATVTEHVIVDGGGATLLCDAGGIKITQSTARKSVEVRDLTFHANGTSIGTALELVFTSIISQTERTAKVVNVDVLTPTGQIATSSFTYGIKLENAWNYLIDRCYVRGSGNDTVNMVACYWMEGQCTDGTMTASHGYFATYGFYAPLTSESEGTKVIGCYFIYVDYGVYMTPTLKQPSFFMSDIHISSLVQCLHVERMDQMNWNNMLLYIRGEVVGLWTAVYLEDCSNNNFSNIVQGGANAVATKTGFEVISSDRNHFTNITLTGVHGKLVETDSASNVYDGISVQNDLDTSRPYLESDDIGKSFFNSFQTIGTNYDTSVPIAVADSAALATVVWDGFTDHSTTGITFNTGDFTTLENPDGVDRFVVTVFIKWDIDSVGIRQVSLFEDGLQIGSTSKTAANESECLIVTKPMNSVIGTSYEVKARQTSGGVLNIVSDSYFDITAA